MATKTILKDDGIFIYEDFFAGKASLRVKELTPANSAFNIRRTSNGPAKAVLVSAAWYRARTEAYALVGAPLFDINLDSVTDDFFGFNLSSMVDLIQGYAQTTSLVKKANAEGTDLAAFKTYAIIDTKVFYKDDNDAIPFDVPVGGNIHAYLLHPTHYQALIAAPVPTIYGGGFVPAVAASLVVQDITYTAVTAGLAGNAITVTYVDPGVASPLAVALVGTDITVTLAHDGVAITTIADDIHTAIGLDVGVSALVTTAVTGVGANLQIAAVQAPLAGGLDAVPGVGTGNGTLDAKLQIAGAITETITITATNATDFTVVGSVTGAMGVATVGTLFTSPQVEIMITDGTIAFVAGDAWVINSIASNI